jgi:hypothetical protein
MKTSELSSPANGNGFSEMLGIPTFDECRRLDDPVRADLELLDYEIRRISAQILADVERSDKDGVLFLRTSATVILSIAAGLMETAAERTGQPFDVESFKAVAEDAAEWAKTRRMRYFPSGEA